MIESTEQRSSSVYPLVVLFLALFLSFFCFRYILIHGLPPNLHTSISKLHWFELKDVKILTLDPLSEPILRSYLPKLEGRSLLAIQPEEIYRNLKDRPWVEEVSIKKEYPDRITILVEPKKARAISFLEGIPHFLDRNGNVIERVPKGETSAYALPFINGDLSEPKWRFDELLSAFHKLKELLAPRFEISEMQFAIYPQFKIFLTKPRMEILFSIENWDKQLPYLMTLLADSPSRLSQIHKINLLFPKKAIVSRPISH